MESLQLGEKKTAAKGAVHGIRNKEIRTSLENEDNRTVRRTRKAYSSGNAYGSINLKKEENDSFPAEEELERNVGRGLEKKTKEGLIRENGGGGLRNDMQERRMKGEC